VSAAPEDDGLPTYGRLVGQRLRLVRQQRRLTLQQVDTVTEGEFKPSVMGAYERGERVISILRLKRLAEFYRVPIDRLLPDTRSADDVDLRDSGSTDRPADRPSAPERIGWPAGPGSHRSRRNCSRR
jgi:transcriptional regulator with XRE-family HTH domain